MRIGLYGIYGTYNFGCEAIVRGAYRFIQDIFPGSEVVYFSYSYEYDKEVLHDLDIKICKINLNKKIYARFINKVLSILNVDRRIFMFDFQEVIDKIDMILSIGGDIYTIPAFLREKAKYPYYNHLVDFCSRTIAMGKKVVVYGASVGPWGNYGKAVEYFTKNMKKYTAIFCREELSVDYLNILGFDNQFLFPDPAFQLSSGESVKTDRKYIGINLSPLSLKEVYGNCGEEQIKRMAALLDKIFETFQVDLLFIPHVLSTDRDDNDLWFMEKVVKQMSHSSHAIIAENQRGFLGAKRQIKECQIVIAARMHCAINALEENIPTIFLSYSQKSIGMCKYIYGSIEWAVEFKNIESELLSKLRVLLESREQVEQLLSIRNKEIAQSYLNILNRIEKANNNW